MPTSTDHAPTMLRQWSLIKALSARHYGMTLREMAQETGVAERTIRRDLNLFLTLGFPLEEVREDYGRKKWCLRSTGAVPQASFTFEEAMALLIARRLLMPLCGTPFGQAAESAFRKIRASFSDHVLRYVDLMAQRVYISQPGIASLADKATVIDELLQGIEESRAVFITYRSQRSTEPVTYDIHPYGLAYHRGALYVVGHSREHKDIRHWKVTRMEEAEKTQFPFKRPPDFDLQAHLAGAFGIFCGDQSYVVKIKFLPAVVRYVTESKWHASQQLAPQTDGSVIARFHLNALEEIKSWVLSFGRHAIVLQPRSLRDMIRKELLATHALYADSPSIAARS